VTPEFVVITAMAAGSVVVSASVVLTTVSAAAKSAFAALLLTPGGIFPPGWVLKHLRRSIFSVVHDLLLPDADATWREVKLRDW
jgi:hypothetical protein